MENQTSTPRYKNKVGRPRGLHIGKKLTMEQASEIKKLYYTTRTSLRKLAGIYNVSHQTIFLIVNGCIWIKGADSL